MTAAAAVTRPGAGLPDTDDAERCPVPTCRARVRTALTEDGHQAAVDADPDPAGNLVWRKTGRQWALRQLAGNEPRHGERRYRRHADTCTPAAPPAPSIAERATDTLAAAGLQPHRADGRPALRLAAVDGHRIHTSPAVATTGPPPLAQLAVDQSAETRTCPRCGMVCAAVVAALEDGRALLIEEACPTGDLVAVDVDGQWQARPTVFSGFDPAPYWHRWSGHRCRRYPYLCQSPMHGRPVPARLYAGGAYCDRCSQARSL